MKTTENKLLAHSAVETETSQKSGVSPKNLIKSRINLFLVSLLTAAVLSVGFSSCSKDKDKDDEKVHSFDKTLTGTWEGGKLEGTVDGSYTIKYQVKFNSDHTFQILKASGESVTTGTWKVLDEETYFLDSYFLEICGEKCQIYYYDDGLVTDEEAFVIHSFHIFGINGEYSSYNGHAYDDCPLNKIDNVEFNRAK
jgi:hypothetical protein